MLTFAVASSQLPPTRFGSSNPIRLQSYLRFVSVFGCRRRVSIPRMARQEPQDASRGSMRGSGMKAIAGWQGYTGLGLASTLLRSLGDCSLRRGKRPCYKVHCAPVVTEIRFLRPVLPRPATSLAGRHAEHQPTNLSPSTPTRKGLNCRGGEAPAVEPLLLPLSLCVHRSCTRSVGPKVVERCSIETSPVYYSQWFCRIFAVYIFIREKASAICIEGPTEGQ